jgi:hypothetical protein
VIARVVEHVSPLESPGVGSTATVFVRVIVSAASHDAGSARATRSEGSAAAADDGASAARTAAASAALRAPVKKRGYCAGGPAARNRLRGGQPRAVSSAGREDRARLRPLGVVKG